MRIHSIFLASVGVLLVIPGGASAAVYEDLQENAVEIQSIIDTDLGNHTADQADLELQSHEEFFPGTGGESSTSSRSSAPSSSFVTFVLNGVTYALTDVPLTQWFAPYVRDAADRGIVSGYRDTNGIPTGIFGPERSVSTEELAKMAIGAAGINTGECSDPPKNVAARESWSASYIRCAERKNFAVYADGTVNITRPATRAEVVMTVLQAFGVTLRDTSAENQKLKDVSDSTLFSSAIYTALHDGVVAGFADAQGNPTGYFGPEKPVNRAEMSKIVSVAIQVYAAE